MTYEKTPLSLFSHTNSILPLFKLHTSTQDVTHYAKKTLCLPWNDSIRQYILNSKSQAFILKVIWEEKKYFKDSMFIELQ